MDPKKLETLMGIANKSLDQLLGVTMDFKGRGFGIIENQKAKVEKVARKLDISYINFAKKPLKSGYFTGFFCIFDIKKTSHF